MDLTLAVPRLAQRVLVQNALLESFSRGASLLHRLRPAAKQLGNLRAMNEAQSVVGNHLGLAIAPLLERLRPRLHVAKLEGGVAEDDCVAVHDAGNDR